MKKILWLATLPALVMGSLVIAKSHSTDAQTKSYGGSLSIVGYSTLKTVDAALISAYQKTTAGKNVTFTQSYGSSGSEAQAVAAGLPADVVNLALEPDMATLVKAGMVSSNWDKAPHDGIVTNSVVVFVVRKGNPQHITTWNDLLNPGVKVLIPNPFQSGSARWNVMAAYGAELKMGQSSSGAIQYLKNLYGHVVAQDPSSSDAMADFLSGTGNVLLTYENEAIAAQKAGDPISYVVPKQTILIQAPVAVTTHSQNAQAAQSFINFLYSTQGQTIYAENGYRPVNATVLKKFAKEFPTPPQLFTITWLGGWNKMESQFFNPTTGVMAKIEAGLGKSVAQ